MGPVAFWACSVSGLLLFGSVKVRVVRLVPCSQALGPWPLALGPLTLTLALGPWPLALGHWTLDLTPTLSGIVIVVYVAPDPWLLPKT